MKRLLTGLGITLLGSVNLIACTSDDSSDDECLPGDIDCAPAVSGGGKADGFDFKNDPVRLSQHLTYKLTELPKTGKRTVPIWKDQYPDAVGKADVAWADTYWPTSEGSHNNRWQGDDVKSPLEKYDAAFNHAAGCEVYPSKFFGTGAKAEWDTYNQCAGPAAKWQSQNFQGGGEMHDGLDNDNDGVTDGEGSSGDVDGIATWWGTCHAWTPASQLIPEPQHSVTVDGVVFEVGDIKALTQNIFDTTSAVMVGGRCNAKTITHNGIDDSANSDCNGVNPGTVHVIMTNFLGLANLALVEDRTANFEVWNQPVMGYDITQQDTITATAANACVGTTGDTWKFNTSATDLVEVRMTVQYLTEGSPSAQPIGSRNNIRRDNYHYILELNASGKIIGGRYCSENRDQHIDFLWSPTGSFSPSNPNVTVSKVKELIAKSVAPIGGGGGNATVFTATPSLAIPDNNPTGVTVDVPVTGLTGAKSLAVSLDISHTYKGDLVVDLLRDGTKVKNLHNQSGGSTDNIVQTYTLSASEVGSTLNGTWSIRVVDTAAVDVGTVNSVKLSFE